MPLSGGYYLFGDRAVGVIRRIVIVPGDRRASYDVWRVSRSGDGTGKRAHFDLIASDDAPSSGRFFITQNGTNCGTLTIEPLQSGGIRLRVLVVRYGIGIERFYPLPEGDARRYGEYDDANTRGILEIASARPRLYGALSVLGRIFYSELSPNCRYD